MTVAPAPPARPSRKQLHARKCVMLGITDADTVARLWAEDEARRAEAERGG